MPSIEDAAFKAHPEMLCAILDCMHMQMDPPGGVLLLSLRKLTLSTFVGSYNRFDESSIPTGFTPGNVPDFLGLVCIKRARARQLVGLDGPPPPLGLGGAEWKTFHVIELRGIHCNLGWRQTLAAYTDELIVDDPFDAEIVSTSSESDGYYSGEEEPSSDRTSEDRDSRRWHSSQASYTDEAAIDEDSEGSVDEDVDEDAPTDDLNINAWGLAEVPSEFDEDDEVDEFGFEF
jgi:hypothetical protein